MANRFLKSSSPLTPEDIQAAEDELGVRLPEEVKQHYLTYNGGVPERSCWPLEKGDEDLHYWIKQFFPIRHSPKGRTMENVYRKGLAGEYLIKGLIPFAEDHGGNYFSFNEHGEVFFYPMDEWDKSLSDEEDKRRILKPVTHSFFAFVDQLEPYRGD